MHRQAPAVSARRSALATGIALLAALAILTLGFGRAAAETGSPTEVKEACISAGLKRPPALGTNFHLQTFPAHKGVTMPLAWVEYDLPSMPEECEGAYRRILYFKVRYKTGLKPWRTLRTWVLFPSKKEKLLAWVPVWNRNDATGGKLSYEIAKEGLEDPQGPVQHVTARARLWVKDLATGRIVGRRTLRAPTRFDRLPHV